MAYDPQVLRAIANPGGMAPMPGGPGAPPAAGQADPKATEPPKSEPAQLLELAHDLAESIKAARASAEELASQAEMSELIDPGVEKAITQAHDFISKADELLTSKVLDQLDEANAEHETNVNGDKPAGKPPADKPPVK